MYSSETKHTLLWSLRTVAHGQKVCSLSDDYIFVAFWSTWYDLGVISLGSVYHFCDEFNFIFLCNIFSSLFTYKNMLKAETFDLFLQPCPFHGETLWHPTPHEHSCIFGFVYIFSNNFFQRGSCVIHSLSCLVVKDICHVYYIILYYAGKKSWSNAELRKPFQKVTFMKSGERHYVGLSLVQNVLVLVRSLLYCLNRLWFKAVALTKFTTTFLNDAGRVLEARARRWFDKQWGIEICGAPFRTKVSHPDLFASFAGTPFIFAYKMKTRW